MRAWTLVEKNGLVMIHHDAAGKPPAYPLPDLPQIGAPDWTPLEVRRWKVKSRWLDMNENAVDQAHFRFVHGTQTTPKTEVELDGHILRCRSRMQLATPRGNVAGGIDTTDFGPGFQTVHLTGIVETLMVNTSTPIDGETTDVSFAYTVNTAGDEKKARGVGAAIIRDLEKQMSEDIPIWENKKYYAQPMLCDGDGPFGVYRRWMRQFFDEIGDEEAHDGARDRLLGERQHERPGPSGIPEGGGEELLQAGRGLLPRLHDRGDPEDDGLARGREGDPHHRSAPSAAARDVVRRKAAGPLLPGRAPRSAPAA